jgi:hypothetical protein
MKARWVFCGVASAVWLVGAIALPIIWLEADDAIPHALGFFSVFQNSFIFAMMIAAFLLAAAVVYSFSWLPKERQQKFIASSMPLALGVGLIIAAGVPVKSNNSCGRTHSVVPVVLAPIFLAKPDSDLSFATYEGQSIAAFECD